LTVQVGGKIFAWIPLNDAGWLGDGVRVAIKASATSVLDLRRVYPADVASAAPLDQRYWGTIRLGRAVPDLEVLDLLADSYRAVVARLPKRLRP
jgi:predicted DNA-binding protein (MmcQ/YjbR family)